jgi:Lrp/AsnC family transcriptional regulator
MKPLPSADEADLKLDRFDLKILAALQENASQSLGELSELVHLSQNACWRRIKRLEDTGIIRKRVALLDATKLRAGLTIFVNVRAAVHSEDWLKTFADGVSRIPEVVEFHRLSGEVDYLLKVRVADIHAFDGLYKRLIRVAPLSDVSSAFAMEELKSTTMVPLSQLE